MKIKFLIICLVLTIFNISLTIEEIPRIDFHSSMLHIQEYKVDHASTNPTWIAVKNLYDQHIINNQTYSEEPRIPKIIHQVWIGSPLPSKYISIIETWKKNHPDWQYILWTDKEINALGLINNKKYHAAKNLGEKSDIAKYEIIYRFGGLYVDTDFECLKPFDVLHHCCDFYSSMAQNLEPVIYAALFAAKKGSPILKKCIDYIKNAPVGLTDSTAIINNTGPGLISRCVFESLPTIEDRTVIFPVTFFYPWPGRYRFQKDRPSIEKWFRPESFGVHHWHCSWQRMR
jgi:inositol phosphorylceramide mannosyltransferase catalytic subunit